jgi:hypothetical protein
VWQVSTADCKWCKAQKRIFRELRINLATRLSPAEALQRDQSTQVVSEQVGRLEGLASTANAITISGCASSLDGKWLESRVEERG